MEENALDSALQQNQEDILTISQYNPITKPHHTVNLFHEEEHILTIFEHFRELDDCTAMRTCTIISYLRNIIYQSIS